MKKLLIVEDDASFRSALVNSLKSSYEVLEAENGKVAREIIPLHNFDLVISDVQMPFLDGIELLEWINKNKPVPFVLMTGFTNIIETQKAYALGATDFISKPFKLNDLRSVVDKILQPPQEQTAPEQEIDNDYCRVSIDEFVSKPKIEFDVFVRLSETKYVKIGYAGDEIPAQRIQSYKEKGVKHLHVRRQDFYKIVGFNLMLSKVLTKKDTISKEKKFNFLKFTGETVLEKAFVEGVDQETYNEAKSMLQTTIEIISETPEYLDLLSLLNQHADWVYAHSVGTAMYSIMIARRMGHTTSQVFFKLGMAGMFHEIGYKELPRELIDKPRPLLNQGERAQLETHPVRAREILSQVRGVPSDVIDIVYEHHEDMLGSGFPRALLKARIHPLAKILQVADVFCDVAIQNSHHSATNGHGALSYIETYYGDKLDKEALQALRSIFPGLATQKTA